MRSTKKLKALVIIIMAVLAAAGIYFFLTLPNEATKEPPAIPFKGPSQGPNRLLLPTTPPPNAN